MFLTWESQSLYYFSEEKHEKWTLPFKMEVDMFSSHLNNDSILSHVDIILFHVKKSQ